MERVRPHNARFLFASPRHVTRLVSLYGRREPPNGGIKQPKGSDAPFCRLIASLLKDTRLAVLTAAFWRGPHASAASR